MEKREISQGKWKITVPYTNEHGKVMFKEFFNASKEECIAQADAFKKAYEMRINHGKS